jgi:hypothetical protein
MNGLLLYRMLVAAISIVWLINGLFCKVLGLVPRHEQIVGRILGKPYAPLFTLLIGFAEIGMAIWIMKGLRHKETALLQILIIAVMNVLEFFLAPDLLLWGRFNAVFAGLLMIIIFYTYFVLRPKLQS